MAINIDEEIDKGRCPSFMFCTVATTVYSKQEREHECYLCWLNYCKAHNIKILYEHTMETLDEYL